jgi:hypothetical protein
MATDRWVLKCPAGTAFARANVLDLPPASLPIVRIALDIAGMADVPAAAFAPQEGLSAFVFKPGAPAYNVVISKTATGFENYRSIMECRTTTGGNLAPLGIVKVLDQ